MRSLQWLLMLIPLMLNSCTSSKNGEKRVRLAKVGGEIIYLDEVLQGMPSELSKKDSTIYVKTISG